MSESAITLGMLWVHVPFAVGWIGVALIDALLAAAPGLSAAQRAALIRLTLPFILLAIPVIAVTGIWQTVYNPVTKPMWSLAILDELKKTTYGWALFYKHVFVVATLLTTLALKLVLVRRLEVAALVTTETQPPPGGVAVALTRPGTDRALQGGALVNLLCCLAILVCVVLMVYQLH